MGSERWGGGGGELTVDTVEIVSVDKMLTGGCKGGAHGWARSDGGEVLALATAAYREDDF